MTALADCFARWWLHMAMGGGAVLLLTYALTRLCRQPAWIQRLSEWGLLAALLVAALSVTRPWLSIPLLPAEPAASASHLSAPPVPSEIVHPGKGQSRGGEVAFVLVPSAALSSSIGEPQAWLEQWEKSDIPLEQFGSNSLPSDLSLGTDLQPRSVTYEENLITAASVESLPVTVSVGILSMLSAEVVLYFLAAGYLCIASLVLGRWLFGHWVLSRLLRRARPACRSMEGILREMTSTDRKLPRLLLSDEVNVPMSCGLFRPTIVLPGQCGKPAVERELIWVFRHELTHLERGDAWTCFLFGLGRTIYFFLPWIWRLQSQVRLCQEYIADAAAAREAPETADYAEYLLSLSQKMTVPVAATGVSGNCSDLFRRMTMLLENPCRVQMRCPLWLSPATALGLLSMSVLISGVSLRAEPAPVPTGEPAVMASQQAPQPPPQPPPPPAKESDKSKGDKSDAPRKVPRDDESRPAPRPFDDQAEPKRFRDQMNRMRQQFPGIPGRGPLGFGGPDGRLGVRVAQPSPAMADQLDLPEGQGLVIDDVVPNSAAAKAGLKPHDVLLQFNGKPVTNDIRMLRESVDEVKADTPVDVVVVRKGKKETIKGIALAEAPKPPQLPQPAQPFRPGPGFGPPSGFQPQFPPAGMPSRPGRHNVMTTVNRNDDRFQITHHDGPVMINIDGTIADGKVKLGHVGIQDGPRQNRYDSLEKVPEQYRDKVNNLIGMVEKGGVHVEFQTPEHPPGQKPKGDEKKD
jgi:beta-lactamase regulating signal transducer with metallopeptidase domain